MPTTLPTGPRGRALALAGTLALAGLLWLGVAAPLLDLHAERAARLAARTALAQRMAALAAELPDLRRQAEAAAAVRPPPRVLLDGDTDALAAAALQGRIEEMARAAGAGLASAEALPAEAVGGGGGAEGGAGLRRVGLRLSVAAPWPALVELLRAIEADGRRLALDDLQIQPVAAVTGPAARTLSASFTVSGMRAGAARP